MGMAIKLFDVPGRSSCRERSPASLRTSYCSSSTAFCAERDRDVPLYSAPALLTMITMLILSGTRRRRRYSPQWACGFQVFLLHRTGACYRTHSVPAGMSSIRSKWKLRCMPGRRWRTLSPTFCMMT